MYAVRKIQQETAPPPSPARRHKTAAMKVTVVSPALDPWLRGQAINGTRHAAALRPFKRGEFGTGAASPTEGHLLAVNELISTLRNELLKLTKRTACAVKTASREPSTQNLQHVLKLKENAHNWVRAIEQIWDFYFELFGQRQSAPYNDWLLSCDRIGLDCYQAVFMGVGIAKSIPAPPPFSYMRTGFSPATFRRGIPLRRLGRQLNPFPLIQLPYHRLVNPWTLGAILHEVSHNLQNELGLAKAIPRNIARRLLAQGRWRFVASVWTRWNRETFADMSGLLLGGPAIVASLMDTVGRAPASVMNYAPRAPHPTPYLRTFISIELLRRMGFPDEAKQYYRAWTRLYPKPDAGTIPPALLKDFHDVIATVVDTICFQPYAELGNKSLAQVTMFDSRRQQMVEEAARRLAAGNDPGIIPERFLIGAARFAFDHRLARPGVISENFYKELSRR